MRLFNLLSLDVVFGAIAGMLFFVHLTGNTVSDELYLLLGISVWNIYTFDHLMDAKAIKGIATMERHRFHQQYFWMLCFALVLASTIAIYMLLTNPNVSFILKPGMYLALGLLVLMISIKAAGPRFAWLKEITTAVFYVAGISLVAWKIQQEVPIQFILFQLTYFLLAWLNLLILSYIDEESDKNSGFSSIFSLLEAPKVKMLIFAVGSAGLLLALGLLLFIGSYYRIYAGILVIILGIHLLQFGGGHTIKKTSRQILEASFLLPFILLIF